MKRLKQIGFALMAVVFLASCGGGNGNDTKTVKSNDESNESSTVFTEESSSGLAVLSTSIDGPLKEFIEIVESKYPIEDYYSKADNEKDNKWKIKIKFKLLKQTNCKNISGGIKIVFYDNDGAPYSGNSDAKFQFIEFPSRSEDLCTLLEGEVGSVNWINFSSSVWIKDGDPLYMNFPKEIKSFKVVSGKER